MYKIATAIPIVLLGGLIVKIFWLPSEAALPGSVILLNDTQLTYNLGEFGCNQTIVVGEKCPKELDFWYKYYIWRSLHDCRRTCWCFKLLVFNTDAVLCKRGGAALGSVKTLHVDCKCEMSK